MTLKINDTIYENINWSVNNNEATLGISAQENFNEIMTTLMNQDSIEIYDNEELISQWFVKEIISMNKLNNEYIIVISGNNISQANEDNIMNLISNAEDALVEIAGMIANVELAYNTQVNILQQHTEQAKALSSQINAQNTTLDTRFKEQANIINTLNKIIEPLPIALTALQNKLATMPNHVNERFAALENSYNHLADRVARLENGR